MRRLARLAAPIACLLAVACSDDPSGPETTPPPPVGDLRISLVEEDALTAAWTVPAPTGAQATPAVHDLRHSADPDLPWDQWTIVATGPAPAPGTGVEVRIDGLATGVEHSVRVRTGSDDGLWSELSGTVSDTPRPAVPGPPPPVDDLAVTGVHADGLTVSWTVPEADVGQGDVTAYDIRYSLDTTYPWPDWTAVVAAAPAAPGARDSVRLTGLAEGADVVVRMRTGSDEGLWSDLSRPVYGRPGASGRVWYVKVDGTGDAPTIQAAVDSARAGDTVLVAPGRYLWTEQVDPGDQYAVDHGMVYLGRDYQDVVIRSEAGPAATILDGEGQGRLFFVQGYNNGCVIDGFSIVDGRANAFDGYAGGGIVGHLSSPTIRNCVFTGNMAIGHGDTLGQGGALWWGGVSSLTLEGCVFTGNEAELGGAVLLVNSYETSVVTDCVFDANHSRSHAGALHIANANVTVRRCVMTDNDAEVTGGAVYVYGGGEETDDTVEFVECTLAGNGSPTGGIHVDSVHAMRLERTIVAFADQGRAVSWNTVGNLTLACCDLWGYPVSNLPPGGADIEGGVLRVDPLFCGWEPGDGPHGLMLDAASSCASVDCGPVGAFPVGCGR